MNSPKSSKDPSRSPVAMPGRLNRLSLVDKLESHPIQRITTARTTKRMSLNLGIPIAPSPTVASKQSPRLLRSQSDANSPNILEMIAYEERRVGELKEELARAELDLENLKQKWQATAHGLVDPMDLAMSNREEPVFETGKRLVKEGVHIFSQNSQHHPEILFKK
ncbi:hypothetical protein NEOLI_004939 [Neolecta irregularis DAH-3]|uniref:Uncharacterized protein n=1 Tax=Neolecta irregularis (strain DAH-3) TaxID=1198029 RepID=A0A1U7LP55_NEOID|nr:hypothetical protein NEOLI_004939 [Neolecta irregularis DAH-3]|eukprot:OLL24446.1 hypothetical protein NEOLI_004939 [Neolecta irregularis DAH-3]